MNCILKEYTFTGKAPRGNKGTLYLLDIDESGDGKYGSYEWGANLDSKDDNKFNITVTVRDELV